MRNLRKLLEEKIQREFDAYVSEYSQGYTKKELENEYDKTYEEMMEIRCESEQLTLEAKSLNKGIKIGRIIASLFIWMAIEVIATNPIFLLFSRISTLIVMSYLLVCLCKTHKSVLKETKAEKIYTNSLRLELKCCAIKKVMLEHDLY